MSKFERAVKSEVLKPHAKLPKDPKTFEIVKLLLTAVIKLVNFEKSKVKNNLISIYYDEMSYLIRRPFIQCTKYLNCIC